MASGRLQRVNDKPLIGKPAVELCTTLFGFTLSPRLTLAFLPRILLMICRILVPLGSFTLVEIPVVGQIVSHYKIFEQVGGGGMGVVYKAQDLRLDRSVALKFLPPDLTRDPEAKQRFIHEAKAASALQHTNICVVHDIDETQDGQLFIVMEYLDGETLKKKIERGPLKIDEAIDIAIQLGHGLTKAHEHGIIHRDIKPANIVVTADGVAKIVDFGLAKLSGRTLLTRSGSTLGTAAYMSPEQAKGEQVDQRTDIWSFGVVLYEMVSGERPFKGEYENALIYSILNADPTPLSRLQPDIPPGLEYVTTKCLAKNRDERYTSNDEVVSDLGKAAAKSPGGGSLSTEPSAKVSGQRRNRTLWYGLAAAGVIAVAFLVYSLFLSQGDLVSPGDQLKMIAVLPFANLAPAEDEDETFTDGLTEDIASRLSAISSLGVISRTSTIQYKKTKKTLPVVASELGVDYVLEGTVRWVKTGTGRRLRITAQLIQVSGDRRLWADNIDRTLDDIFIVQTEIATRVVDALGIVLRPREKGVVEAIPTRNLDAYQAYLRGKATGLLNEEASMKTAMEMYERAVTLDTTFAEAYAALAGAHLAYSWWGHDRTPERIALAKKALDNAFALKPELAQASVVLGLYYYWGFRDYEMALDALKTAEERNPSNSAVLANRAYILKRQGHFEEALKDLQKAFRLDPKYAGYASQIGVTLIHLGAYPEAEIYFDRAISLRPDESFAYLMKAEMILRSTGDTRRSRNILELVPAARVPWENLIQVDIYERNYPKALERLAQAPVATFVSQKYINPVSQWQGLVYRFTGDATRSREFLDSARVSLERAIAKNPEDYRLHMSMGITMAGLGRAQDALRASRRARELMALSVDAVDGAYPLLNLAQVYTLLGDRDNAVNQIDFLLDLPAPKLLTVPLLRLDPIYDPLRSDPRFQTLLAKYGRSSAE